MLVLQAVLQLNFFKFIANTVDRMDKLLTRQRVGDLAPELLDMAVYGAVADDAVVMVDPVYQLVTAEYSARI